MPLRYPLQKLWSNQHRHGSLAVFCLQHAVCCACTLQLHALHLDRGRFRPLADAQIAPVQITQSCLVNYMLYDYRGCGAHADVAADESRRSTFKRAASGVLEPYHVHVNSRGSTTPLQSCAALTATTEDPHSAPPSAGNSVVHHAFDGAPTDQQAVVLPDGVFGSAAQQDACAFATPPPRSGIGRGSFVTPQLQSKPDSSTPVHPSPAAGCRLLCLLICPNLFLHRRLDLRREQDVGPHDAHCRSFDCIQVPVHQAVGHLASAASWPSATSHK